MNLYIKDDLERFNEVMLGRGMPLEKDGIGYNKADYDICSAYYYGLSNIQYANLAKRLVKYTKTQLKVDKDTMTATAKYFLERSDNCNVGQSISIQIREEGTLVSFRYNELFIQKIKEQPRRKFDKNYKKWIVPNENILDTLKSLEAVGADVKSAITYAKSHELLQKFS